MTTLVAAVNKNTAFLFADSRMTGCVTDDHAIKINQFVTDMYIAFTGPSAIKHQFMHYVSLLLLYGGKNDTETSIVEQIKNITHPIYLIHELLSWFNDKSNSNNLTITPSYNENQYTGFLACPLGIFEFDSDGVVMKILGYSSVGSGSMLAMGSLFTSLGSRSEHAANTESLDDDVFKSCNIAMDASKTFDNRTGGEITKITVKLKES